jgi:hypothetical protein
LQLGYPIPEPPDQGSVTSELRGVCFPWDRVLSLGPLASPPACPEKSAGRRQLSAFLQEGRALPNVLRMPASRQRSQGKRAALTVFDDPAVLS